MICYLAAPYYDPDVSVRRLRLNRARTACQRMFDYGIPVYSPLQFADGLRIGSSWEPDEEVWRLHGLELVRVASLVVVLDTAATAKSAGVDEEIIEAKKWQIPQVMYKPNAPLDGVLEAWQRALTVHGRAAGDGFDRWGIARHGARARIGVPALRRSA